MIEACRSAALRGAVGTVLSFDGRQVEVELEGQERPRLLNPNDLTVMS